MSENNGNGRFRTLISDHWGKALSGLIFVITTIIGIKMSVMEHSEKLRILEPKVISLEQFKVVQLEVNRNQDERDERMIKYMDKIDGKLDKLIERKQ